MELLRFWIKNARCHALAQSALPSLLAVSLALGRTDFSPFLALLAVFGVMMGHMGCNLFDDYFDFRVQNTNFRNTMAREGMRARIAKCPYLTSGEATLGQLLAASCVYSGLALLAGLFIWLRRGEPILFITLFTAFLGLAYSGWPLRLSYHGLGELLIGLVFGPLLMSGVYYAACGSLDPSILFIAVPVGLLVMNIIYVHSIMDYEPDKRVGKKTLAVLVDSRRLMLAILVLVLMLPYLLISVGMLTGKLSPANALVFLTLAPAVMLFRLMLQYARDPRKPVRRRFWMGPMSGWDRVRANGIDWFMLRWFLARNLLLFFCLSIAAARLASSVLGRQ
jgi:1,4-dihydroxy-2-naphthoate octaprenyltransferase